MVQQGPQGCYLEKTECLVEVLLISQFLYDYQVQVQEQVQVMVHLQVQVQVHDLTGAGMVQEQDGAEEQEEMVEGLERAGMEQALDLAWMEGALERELDRVGVSVEVVAIPW